MAYSREVFFLISTSHSHSLCSHSHGLFFKKKKKRILFCLDKSVVNQVNQRDWLIFFCFKADNKVHLKETKKCVFIESLLKFSKHLFLSLLDTFLSFIFFLFHSKSHKNYVIMSNCFDDGCYIHFYHMIL